MGDKFATDFLQIWLVKIGTNHRKKPWVYRMIRDSGSTDLISLGLPSGLSNAILDTLFITQVERFEHLLPLSHTPWLDRCNQFVEKQLSASPERARILVRDYLAKQLFEKTANEAVVRLVCDQTTRNNTTNSRQQVSLSHYIDFAHEDIWTACKDAWQPLFGRTDFPASVETRRVESDKSSKFALTVEQFKSLSELMIKRTNEHYGKNDPVLAHNAIAEYSLFLLIAATGHRKSKTPFYFPWDLCLDEKIAFICDKQVIGAEARVVPLPQTAIDQYCAYISHLHELLPKLTSPKFSETKKHVEILLASVALQKSDPISISLTDPQCGQFFWIDDANKPQTISTHRLNQIVQKEHSRLSIQGLRNRFAYLLWKKLTSGTSVQTLSEVIRKRLPQTHINQLRHDLQIWVSNNSHDKKIIPDGKEVQTLNEIIQKKHSEINILRFRNGLADYLWRTLKNGIELQAWLGHASEFHPFGEASTWSMIGQADKLRTHIEEYLTERGLALATVHSTSIEHLATSPATYKNTGIPSIKIGTESYEGRSISKKFASARALKTLQKLLPGELIEWQQNSNIDGEFKIEKALAIDTPLYKRLVHELICQLGTDSHAIAQVTQTLSAKIRQLGKLGVKNSTPKVNLFQSDPGPVNINFSRHLRIANELRERWISKSFGQGLDRSNDVDQQLFKRLAHLAISLIIFDATLDPIRVKALTLAANKEGGIQVHPHTLTLRACIRTARDIYDWLILPSPLTTALLFGLLRARKSSQPTAQKPEIDDDEQIVKTFDVTSKTDEALWKNIQKEINKSLQQMQIEKAGAVNNIDELCKIFRPWWQLRLPGTLAAVSTGDYVGPAPSIESVKNLFGTREPTPFVKQDKLLDTSLPIATAKKSIKDCINEILRKSEATLSRTSRKNLLHELKQPYEHALLRYIDEQPIVRHALGFIEYLLDAGGPHQPVLRFSSIRTYYSNVIPLLIDAWWDTSFTEWTGEEFNQAYQVIFKLSSKEKSSELSAQSSTLNALRQFHRYLRDRADVPFCSLLFQKQALPAQRRSDIVTRSAIEHAIEDIHNDSSIPTLARLQAKALIAFTAGYGLRNSEAMALSTDSFIGKTGTQHIVAVIGNEFADTKSGAARRIIGCPLMSNQLTNIATKALEKAKLERKPGVAKSSNPAIIAINEESGWSKPRLSQHCIATLRRSAASNSTVLHTLRHTFATAVMLELLKQAPLPTNLEPRTNEFAYQGLSSRACDTARIRLVETKNENTVHDMLQTPVNWPFNVDSVAQVMGHSDVSTLLNFYFHGAPILLAEHIHCYSRNESLIDERIALLLNITRTTVVHRRKKSKLPSTGNISNFQALGRIEQLFLIDLKEFREPDLPININDQSTPTSNLEQLTWAKLDDLLMDRMTNRYSLDSLKERTNSLDDDSKIGDHFVNVYTNLIEQSCFDDFEFENSELTSRKPKHRQGVVRSREERRKSLGILESACFHNLNLRDELKILTEAWCSRIDPEKPWLVLKNESEGRAFVSFCKILDINFLEKNAPGDPRKSDLKICSTGHPNAGLLKYFLSENIEISPHASNRFSRSTGKVSASEIGIQFLQRRNSNIGDGRDAHRLLLVLAVALNTFSVTVSD
jgi:site-specific recombinase XerD